MEARTEADARLAGVDPTTDGRNAAVFARCEAFNQLPDDRFDRCEPAEVIDLRTVRLTLEPASR